MDVIKLIGLIVVGYYVVKFVLKLIIDDNKESRLSKYLASIKTADSLNEFIESTIDIANKNNSKIVTIIDKKLLIKENIRTDIKKLAIRDIKANSISLPSQGFNEITTNSRYMHLSKLICEAIDESNDLILGLSISELINENIPIMFQEKIHNRIGEMVINESDTLSFLDFQLILNTVHATDINIISIIFNNITSRSSFDSLLEYINDNPKCHPVFKLAFINFALLNDKEQAKEYIDDYLNYYWDDYHFVNMICELLPLKELLGQNGFREIIKQRSVLHTTIVQNDMFISQHQEQQKTQINMNNQLNDMGVQLHKNKEIQQESLNIQRTERDEKIQAKENLAKAIKRDKNKKLGTKIIKGMFS